MLSAAQHQCSGGLLSKRLPTGVVGCAHCANTRAHSNTARRRHAAVALANSSDAVSSPAGSDSQNAALPIGQLETHPQVPANMSAVIADVLNQQRNQHKPVEIFKALDSRKEPLTTTVRRSWDSSWVTLQLEGSWLKCDQAREMAMLAVFQERIVERAALLMGLLQHVDSSLPGLLAPQDVEQVLRAQATNGLNPAVDVLLPDQLTLLCAAVYPLAALLDAVDKSVLEAGRALQQQEPFRSDKSLLPLLREDLRLLHAACSRGTALARLRALLLQRRPPAASRNGNSPSATSNAADATASGTAATAPGSQQEAGASASAPWAAVWAGDPLGGSVTLEQMYHSSVSPREAKRLQRQKQQPQGQQQLQQQQRDEWQANAQLRRGGAGAVGTFSFRRRVPRTYTARWLQQQPGAVGEGSFRDAELAAVIDAIDEAIDTIVNLRHAHERDQQRVSREVTRARRAVLLDLAIEAARHCAAVPKLPLPPTCRASVSVSSSERCGLRRRIAIEVAEGGLTEGSNLGSELMMLRRLVRDKQWAFLDPLGAPFANVPEWTYAPAAPAVWCRLVVSPPLTGPVTLTIKQGWQQRQQQQQQRQQGPRQLAVAPGSETADSDEGSPLPPLTDEAAADASLPLTPTAVEGVTTPAATALAAAPGTGAGSGSLLNSSGAADVTITLSVEEMGLLVQQLTEALAHGNATPEHRGLFARANHSQQQGRRVEVRRASRGGSSSSSALGSWGAFAAAAAIGSTGAGGSAISTAALAVQQQPAPAAAVAAGTNEPPLLELWVDGALSAQLPQAQVASLLAVLDDAMLQLPGSFTPPQLQQPPLVVRSRGLGSTLLRSVGGLLGSVARAALVAAPAVLLFVAILRPLRDSDGGAGRHQQLVGGGARGPGTALVLLQGQDASAGMHQQQQEQQQGRQQQGRQQQGRRQSLLQPLTAAQLGPERLQQLCQGVAGKVQGRMWVPLPSETTASSSSSSARAPLRAEFQVVVDAGNGQVLGCKPASPDALPLYQELPLSGLLRGQQVAAAQERYLASLSPEQLQAKRWFKPKPGSLALRYRPAAFVAAPKQGMAVLKLVLRPSLSQRQEYGQGDKAVRLALMEVEVGPWGDGDSLEAWTGAGSELGQPQAQEEWLMEQEHPHLPQQQRQEGKGEEGQLQQQQERQR